jgi:hypothetical protein
MEQVTLEGRPTLQTRTSRYQICVQRSVPTTVGTQFAHTGSATRNQHGSMRGSAKHMLCAAPGPPRRSAWLHMARRWRPEMGRKQGEHHGQRAAGIGMCMRADGQTCSRAAALAVQVDPPSPAARPGPIHGMGRAVRCRAHALTGPTSAKCNAEHESRPTFVRTFIPRPAQVGEGCSAHDCDHNDRRKSRWHTRVDKCAHLQTLPEEFERRAGTTGQVKTWRGQRALEDGA